MPAVSFHFALSILKRETSCLLADKTFFIPFNPAAVFCLLAVIRYFLLFSPAFVCIPTHPTVSSSPFVCFLSFTNLLPSLPFLALFPSLLLCPFFPVLYLSRLQASSYLKPRTSPLHFRLSLLAVRSPLTSQIAWGKISKMASKHFAKAVGEPGKFIIKVLPRIPA